MQSLNLNLNTPIQFDDNSFALHNNELINSTTTQQLSQPPRSENLLEIGPPQSSTANFLGGT